jgi:predicted lipoprotein with Yx(FWY)xxD motif
MTSELRGTRRRQGRIGPLVVVALVLATGLALLIVGCGGSSATGAAATSTVRHGPAGAATITTVTGRDGTYLADSSGRSLYLWLGDGAGKSNCSGNCALSWPPLLTSATPKVAGAATAADVGTLTRADGTRQVTYHGHPLYRFVVDSGPGTTKGQGSDSYGARWWLVAPTGRPITVNGGSSVAPPISY